MIAGFDYGTSNCAISAISDGTQQVSLVELEQGKCFVPSTLYALERELIVESVALNIKDNVHKTEFLQSRKNQLTMAQRVRREADIQQDEQSLFFGRDAFGPIFSSA